MAVQSDHDLLVGLHISVGYMKDRLVAINGRIDSANSRVEKQDVRLRAVEKSIWLAGGGLAVLMVLLRMVGR